MTTTVLNKSKFLFIIIVVTLTLSGCLVSEKDFFSDKKISPFKSLMLTDKDMKSLYIIKKDESDKTYIVFGDTDIGAKKIQGEIEFAPIEVATSNEDIIKNTQKDTLLFKFLAMKKEGKPGYAYGILILDSSINKGLFIIDIHTYVSSIISQNCKKCDLMQEINEKYGNKKEITSNSHSIAISDISQYKSIISDVLKEILQKNINELSKHGDLISINIGLQLNATNSIHSCDEDAAHPDDISVPYHSKLGVNDNSLNVEQALNSCVNAVEDYPNIPRFRFQLGRALLKNKQYNQAVADFIVAAKSGHTGAKFYLAYLYEKGIGVETNQTLAKNLYQEAAEGNFKPAQDFLAAQSSPIPQKSNDTPKQSTNNNSAFSGYNSPEIMNAIYQNNYSAIPDDLETRRYVASISSKFNQICSSPGWGVGIAMMSYIKAGEGFPLWRASGYQDAILFIKDYGCEGKETFRFQNNLHDLIIQRSKKELSPPKGARYATISQACLDNLASRPSYERKSEYRRNEYCNCAATILNNLLSVSFQERNLLLQNFDNLETLYKSRSDLASSLNRCRQ